jgi:hypothetical protein
VIPRIDVTFEYRQGVPGKEKVGIDMDTIAQLVIFSSLHLHLLGGICLCYPRSGQDEAMNTLYWIRKVAFIKTQSLKRFVVHSIGLIFHPTVILLIAYSIGKDQYDVNDATKEYDHPSTKDNPTLKQVVTHGNE